MLEEMAGSTHALNCHPLCVGIRQMKKFMQAAFMFVRLRQVRSR